MKDLTYYNIKKHCSAKNSINLSSYFNKNLTFIVFVTSFIITLFPVNIFGQPSKLSRRTTIKSASEYDYPPFCIVNKDGKADGFSVELLRETLNAVNLDVQFSIGPWSEVKEKLENGTVQVLPLVGRTPEREELFDFTFPYLTRNGAIFVRKDETSINSLEDLYDKRVAVMKDDNSEEFARRTNISSNIIAVATSEQAMKLLNEDKCDAVIAQRVMGLNLLKTMQISNVIPLDFALDTFQQDFCFAVEEGDKELLALLNEGLSIVIATGKFDELHKKWFSPVLEKQISWENIIKYVLIIFIPFTIIYVIVSIILLRHQVKRKTYDLTKEIIKHKKTEEELIESEKKYKSLSEHIKAGIVIHAPDTTILHYNRTAKTILGLPNEQIDGEIAESPTWHFVKPNGQKMEISEYPVMQVKKTNKPILDFVLGLKQPNNENLIWLLINAYPEFNDDKTLSTIVVTFVNITERENALNTLQVTNRRHAAMIENIGDVIAIMSADKTFSYISPNCANISGWTQAEMTGVNAWDFMHPDDSERVLTQFNNLISKDMSITTTECRTKGKNDKYRWVKLTAVNRIDDHIINGILINYHDITEEKQAQLKLEEREQHFSEMFMEAPLGYQSLDEDGIFKEVNKVWLETLGYDREEVIGKWFGDFLAPNYVEAFKTNFPIFKRNGRTHPEFEMVDKSGKYKFIEFEGRIGHKANDNSLRTHCIIQDRTEQKKEEIYRDLSVDILKILNETQTFNEVINNTLVAIKKAIGCDAAGIRLQKNKDFPYFVQKGFSDNFLLTEDSILERDSNNNICLNSDGTASLECTCGLIISGKTDDSSPFFTERGSFWTNDYSNFMNISKNRDMLNNSRNKCILEGYKSIALIPVNTHGKIIGLLQINSKDQDLFTLNSIYVLEGIASHIAEAIMRIKAEAELHSEKERLAITLSSIGDGVITTDINGKIIMINKVAEKLTEWTYENAIGQPLSDVLNIVDESKNRQCDNTLNTVLKTGNIIEQLQHTYLISKNDHKISIANTAAPIRNSNNDIIGVVLVFRDITEKEKLDEAIQREQKLESLGVLAGGLAHDFNNLLGSIFGYIEMAKDETENINATNLLTESLNSIDRAKALTQQLLTFSKGGIPIKLTDRLFPFVEETVQFALSGTSVSSIFNIDSNLWLCNFDKNQIAQVIDNLAINAQQAMPNGGVLEVTAKNISLKENEHPDLKAGKYIKISLKDHGIGIPKELLIKIFDPYYTTKTKGHGLGLASCYSIIKKHDGYIDVQSELGNGSTFNVYLPATADKTVTNKMQSKQKHHGSGIFLVMDDEKTIQDITKRMLESFGYNVVVTQNGQEAIDFVKDTLQKNEKIAGMIFDLTIPSGIGGKEAIGIIREICKETPAFVSSGYSSDPIMADPHKFGFTASISKPFMKNELATMLEKYLNTEAV